MMNLGKLRKSKGYSQVYVAKKLGVRQSTLSQYENGQRKISADNAKKLAKIYGVDWWTLFDDGIEHKELQIKQEDKQKEFFHPALSFRKKRTPEQIGISFWCMLPDDGDHIIDYTDGYTKGIYDALNAIGRLDVLASDNVRISLF